MAEPQYSAIKEQHWDMGPVRMGLHSSWSWRQDPKRLGFVLAHYKFVAKMLAGARNVLEVGCADGFYSRIVAAEVGFVTALDFDPDFIDSAVATRQPFSNVGFHVHDMMGGKFAGAYDAFYCMDVLEHIHPKDEQTFLLNAAMSLGPHGVGIVGCPSLESQRHASELSRLGHVNCKTQADLKATMQERFFNVFMFSFNDETLHTGFAPMAQYNVALCCRPKPPELGR